MLAAVATAPCVRAHVGGRAVCLNVGLACAPRYERVYRSYAFTCKLGADGRRHLHVYNYIGPPNP